jgi:AcrR family transcriptional regulator
VITHERPAGAAPGPDQAPQSSRQRIVETARDLFVDRGYMGVSMQQIADATGLRKASLYHHFRSKESLFADVMALEMDHLLADLEAVRLVNRPIAEQLEELALMNYRRFGRPELHQLAHDFFRYVPESEHEEVHKRLREMEALFAGIFSRAMASGELEPIEPHHAATMYFHMMMSLANDPNDYRSTPPPPPEEAAALVSHIMLHGLARHPD